MKALSIRQPYAWLIVQGIKDIENRTWTTGFRGPVLIHAGVNYPKRDYEDDFESFAGRGFPLAREQMVGGIVGIATITGCVTSSASPWWRGPAGFTLANARPCPLVPMRGALGFFDVPPSVLEQLPAGFLPG
ncbi:MAG TPA: ASCH domain-containing protein [Ramlibacter sp.]|nr:ASCH domain-containing protein [Ramlibacter sp.]